MEVQEEPHNLGPALLSLQVFWWVELSIVKDQSLCRPLVVRRLVGEECSDRTLEVALDACRIVLHLGIDYSIPKDFENLDRIVLVVVCSRATVFVRWVAESWGRHLLCGIREVQGLYLFFALRANILRSCTVERGRILQRISTI